MTAFAPKTYQQQVIDSVDAYFKACHELPSPSTAFTARYLRPLVLIQAEPRRAGVEPLDIERVRKELVTNHGIPDSEIVTATGEEKGLEQTDFLCQLPGSADQAGAILAVEYKGADRWACAEDDRLIGGLWASLSEGRCRFVMVKDKRWEWIEEKLPRPPVPQR